jgi:hypothetical protein
MRNFLLFLSLILPCGLARTQDFQSWNEVDLTASWRKVDFLAPFLARTDSSLPNPQLAATGLTADFPLQRHITLTGGYLFADLPQKSLAVHVPLVAVSNAFRLGRTTLAERNRFEKLFDYPNQPVRYRNRVLADEALGTNHRWHLFANDEVFFDLTAGAWSQNRLQAGGGVWLRSRALLDLYYLRRNASGGAAPVHVLGTTLRLALTPPNHGR